MKRRRYSEQLRFNFQSKEYERDGGFRARPRPRSPLTRPRPSSTASQKDDPKYDPQFLVAGMCLNLMRETEHVRICSERIDSVLRNPSASKLWNGDGRSPLHLGMEQFDVLVPSHGNPFEFDINDTFVRRAAADDDDADEEENVVEKKKLKVDISTIRRESKKKKKKKKTQEPESPDAVWDINMTTTNVTDKRR